MPSVADLKVELDDIVTMKFIASAFTEASAARLKGIKDAFQQNKEFYEEISHVYHLVRLAGEAQKIKNKKKAPEEAKMLMVAITSNQRFYGNLNVAIMHQYLGDIEKRKTDLLVVGVTGHDYMRSMGYVHPFEKLIFVKDSPNPEETRLFLDKIRPYDTVWLYYPKFMTLVTQTVGINDITQAANPAESVPKDEIHILFEPEYAKILDFFQHQVRALLFLRVMLEADLSRTAARLLTMSAAEERSDELIKDKKSELRKVKTSIVNAQLLETFAGMSKWKK